MNNSSYPDLADPDKQVLLSLIKRKESLMLEFLASTREAADLCARGSDDLDLSGLVSLIGRREDCIAEIDAIDRKLLRIGPKPENLSRSEWEDILRLLESIGKTASEAAAFSRDIESSLALYSRHFQGEQASMTGGFAARRSIYGDFREDRRPRFLDTLS